MPRVGDLAQPLTRCLLVLRVLLTILLSVRHPCRRLNARLFHRSERVFLHDCPPVISLLFFLRSTRHLCHLFYLGQYSSFGPPVYLFSCLPFVLGVGITLRDFL